MILGTKSVGHYAFGEIIASEDLSTADPFAAFLSDPKVKKIYLIELYPFSDTVKMNMNAMPPIGTLAFGEYDLPYSGGIVPVYLSSNGFKTEPDDSIPSQYFIAQVDNPFQFETGIFTGDGFSGGNQSFGAINILNGDGRLDYLNEYFWTDRRVVIKAGGENFRYANFVTIFDGVANDFEADEDSIIITIKDKRAKTDQNLQPGNYAGTGGLEGGSDLANKPKPLAFGKCFNVEPILVDAFTLVYQFHAGSASAVDAVRDSGVALTYAGDVPNITAVVPPAGHFYTQLNKGLIKLGSTPAGRITADVQGDNVGGYSSKIGGIIKKVLTVYLGLSALELSEIDEGSLNRLELEVSGDMGIYVPEQATASEIIDKLIYSVGAYWNMSRQGQFFVGVVKPPTIPVSEITADKIDQSGVKISTDLPPAWRISVGYAPAWTVQEEQELALATTATDKTFVSNQFRYVTFEDSSVRARNKSAMERQFNTTLANKADAEALLARMASIYATRRRIFEALTYDNMFRLFIGDTTNLKYDRHSLNDGKNLLVVGIGEDAETEQTTFRLWG